ncbi:MAG: hypothetical protein ACKO4Q_09970, partial [Planctomycetota bacterium]
TSNLGSAQMKAGASLGFGKVSGDQAAEDRRKRMRTDVMFEVERHFRPEFLNRVDEMVIFNQLSTDDLRRIVGL